MDIKGNTGNTIVGRYIREENRLVTLNPLGHRPIKDIGCDDRSDKNSPEIQDLRWLQGLDRKNTEDNGNNS